MRESGKIGAVLLASALVCLAAPRRASWAEAAETTAPLSSATSPALSLADEGSSLAIDAEEESPVAHWRLLEPSNPPPPRLGALMVYATDRQRTLLFGGFLENGEYCNETWEYDGRTWKQLDIASPPANPLGIDAYMPYDPTNGTVSLGDIYRIKTPKGDYMIILQYPKQKKDEFARIRTRLTQSFRILTASDEKEATPPKK